MKYFTQTKTLLVLPTLLLLFLSVSCTAQSVPGKVKAAFAKKFQNVNSVEWGKESEDEYEAEFKMKSVSYSANFSEDGTWIETEMEIAMSDLPDAVLASLARDYWDTDIDEIARISNAEGTLYEVAIRKENEEEDHEEYEENEHEEDNEHGEEMAEEKDEDHGVIDLIFNESGQLVKKVGSGSKEEDED